MRKRTCSRRCHNAHGTKCKCVCQGFYHGSAGAVNREALHQGTEEEAKELLKQHGFKEGETRYIEQRKLPLENTTKPIGNPTEADVLLIPEIGDKAVREKLDKETILQLLQKADSKWFATHGGLFNYQEHLGFTAEYIMKHYKGGNNADNKLHHARSRSPDRLEAKAGKDHTDTPRQGLLNY